MGCDEKECSENCSINISCTPLSKHYLLPWRSCDTLAVCCCATQPGRHARKEGPLEMPVQHLQWKTRRLVTRRQRATDLAALASWIKKLLDTIWHIWFRKRMPWVGGSDTSAALQSFSLSKPPGGLQRSLCYSRRPRSGSRQTCPPG